MWFDLSPMRPDAWAQTNYRRWVEAEALRAAYQQGYTDAKDEHSAASTAQAEAKKATR